MRGIRRTIKTAMQTYALIGIPMPPGTPTTFGMRVSPMPTSLLPYAGL